MARRTRARVVVLYATALLREFRGTVLLLLSLLLAGMLLHAATPLPSIGGARPTPGAALYAAWMALLGEPVLDVTGAWHLMLVEALYPLLGLVLVGEGVVRFGLLMLSRRRGEKEWMRVMASTYRNHVVLCGLGHLGFRVLEQLLAHGVDVVAIEHDPRCRFLAQAKATGVPVLERDMKDDQALVEAGVPYARAIILASNDDMANLEVALDARRMRPSIRVVMRLFDQGIASKIKDAFMIDQAFSASALAAPAVAAMALEAPVLARFRVGGEAYVTAEVAVEQGSPLLGRTVSDVELCSSVRVLQVLPTDREPGAQLRAGDRVVVTGPAHQVHALVAGSPCPAP